MWVLLSIHSYILSLTHHNAPGNRALWQMGIQHQDLSASNMMYKRINAHSAEAVCWVIIWLGLQYKDGTRVKYSFQDWEMVDATTCCMKKCIVTEDLQLYPFTEPNELLQEPIRNLLIEFEIRNFQKRFSGEGVPVPDVGVWIDECDKKIRAQVSEYFKRIQDGMNAKRKGATTAQIQGAMYAKTQSATTA